MPGGISTIEGGSQALLEAMADALAVEPRLSEPVRAIVEDAGGVSLRMSAYVIRAHHAICTVPFTALRTMLPQAQLTPGLSRMISGLPNTRASFAYIAGRRPFWREIGRRIEAKRPAAKDQVEVLKLFSWQRSPYAGGIYNHIGTGMARDLAEATGHVGQRLHFAGEHLVKSCSGMEGALESGERAARTVLARSALRYRGTR